MSPRDVYVLLAELVVGYLFWPYRYCRRWYLRLRLRRRMRALGMIPAITVLWAGVEVGHVTTLVAQQPGDSLITTLLVRAVVGQWQADNPIRAYCLTWYAERTDRPHVLILLDVAPADTTVRPICPDTRFGGFLPVFLDAPACPPDEQMVVTDREFVLVRCSADGIARYKRRIPGMRSQ